MGKRATSRRLAMQAVFQAEQGGFPINEALSGLFDNDKFLSETKDFARRLARKAHSERERLDAVIKSFLKDWSLERLSGVDLSILRIAILELEMGETPQNVVVNEALGLAEKYSSVESIKFINGILGAYLKKS
ncbi:transcription antitermination factor NusB [candidate division WOR-1 bacterium RIFOXYA12_FULL_43_27]|uniref:Transcription antitermination protein NusB n=1 Tax=candidate division WOR-1 bacterium RIFOXYC2_FULL_46_14 TaxID=1802587 RepID=A0A1F4U7B3_UNCSA|nr:MAG: transcription antitermination factor NusB [candidate division WOR-1 bacterium RIFOXYA12_FULL_43_27]OGC19178.1 MAG: transcription antitermination factor NusB [candidate division WOR-1 bacterium RIFOXYB2_FULL_46_45]OGC30167.1 MAG: transcription antitermination factor NusB [candidate division WOR-1 bacterium RIFOXYA2_FULL_46_56]OGC40769.1 MAG: transcription antitermination factor NusB [candidate division WOR-1 bacterium RIFOXYC2_FULL_46_14]